MEWLIIPIVIIAILGLVYLIIGRRATRHIQQLKQTIATLEKSYKETLNLVKDNQIKCNKVINERIEEEEKLTKLYEETNVVTRDIKEKEDQLKRLDNIYNEILTNKKENINNEAEEFKKKVYDDILKEVEDCRLSAENQKKIINEEYEKEKQNFENILQEYRNRQESIIKLNKEQE